VHPKQRRKIERSEYQEVIEWNNNNVNANKDYYRTRHQIVEQEKVLAEVAIVFTAYNLRRSVSILGFDDLMSKLKAHFAGFAAQKCCES